MVFHESDLTDSQWYRENKLIAYLFYWIKNCVLKNPPHLYYLIVSWFHILRLTSNNFNVSFSVDSFMELPPSYVYISNHC